MRPALAWLAPDLALVGATVTLFYCLFLFQGYQKLFRDSDAGWHIRNGESILATRQLPRTDPYSFSRPGAPWFAWEWASDVLSGAIHRAAGLRGVALFYGTAIAAGVWLWFRLHWQMGGNFLLASILSPLLLSTSNLHWMARPHVLGWLFLLLLLRFAESSPRPFHWRDAFGIAVLSVLWANMHASFFFAPLILSIYAVGRIHRKYWTRFAWAALIAALAPLVNPYGWHLYQHVYRYLTDSELLAHIAEFQSFDYHTAGSGQIIAALLLGVAGGVLSFLQGRYERALLALVVTVIAFRSARGLPLAALLLLPIANAAITPLLDRRVQSFGDGLRAIDARFSGLALAPLALYASFAILRLLPTGFPPEYFPIAAYPHIPQDARLFAPDKFGGYLIYRSNGARKVFFDGRSDFYGTDFLKQYSLIVQVRPGWRPLWDSFQFTHALLPGDYPLVDALQAMGWREVYRDATATLLERGKT